MDTSNEIGGDGDVPHPAIGGARRMQVPDPSQQHRIMVLPVIPSSLKLGQLVVLASCSAVVRVCSAGRLSDFFSGINFVSELVPQ